jgi:hypothetical protein
MPILEGPLLLRLAPENLISPVGIERRIDIDEVDAGVGQFLQLLQVVAAIDNSRIEKR